MSNFPELLPVVNTIADMQALGLASTQYTNLQVLGYYSANDGGGGLFTWNPSSTDTVDNGTIFQATGVSTGRWNRVLNAPISVEMFGAYSDGTNPTTTLAAFQAANDYVAASTNPCQKILMGGSNYNFGTSATGVVKAASFFAPNWVGAGASANGTGTYITYNPPAEASAFQFVGDSGSLCGGSIIDVGFTGNTNTIAVESQGQGGLITNISVFGVVKLAVLLHNKLSGQFTEFNQLTVNSVGSSLQSVIEYRVTSGNSSFHGSGLVGGVVGFGASLAPAVIVGSGAFPYNAPLNATFFPTTGASILIQNNSSTAFGEPWFVGNIKVETGAATSITIGNNGAFFLCGGVTVFGADNWFMGTCYTGSKFGSLTNSQRISYFDPINLSGPITGTTTTIPWPLNTSWNHYLVTAEVLGNGYIAFYTATVTFVEGGTGYNTTTIVQTTNVNTAGYGNLVLGFPSSGAGIQLSAATSPYVTGQNLRYRITLTQIGQGSDHFIQ